MSNYYVFSNGEKLYCLAKKKDVKGLQEEVKFSVIQKRDSFQGVAMGSQSVFEIIFNALMKCKAYKALQDISRHIECMAVEKWDIATLLAIKARQVNCGELTENGKRVIAEYESYKEIACEEFKKRNLDPEWKVEYEGVSIVFDKGRLSFYKNGMEHVIFYGEDKDFTLTQSSDNKVKMSSRTRAHN